MSGRGERACGSRGRGNNPVSFPSPQSDGVAEAAAASSPSSVVPPRRSYKDVLMSVPVREKAKVPAKSDSCASVGRQLGEKVPPPSSSKAVQPGFSQVRKSGTVPPLSLSESTKKAVDFLVGTEFGQVKKKVTVPPPSSSEAVKVRQLGEKVQITPDSTRLQTVPPPSKPVQPGFGQVRKNGTVPAKSDSCASVGRQLGEKVPPPSSSKVQPGFGQERKSGTVPPLSLSESTRKAVDFLVGTEFGQVKKKVTVPPPSSSEAVKVRPGFGQVANEVTIEGDRRYDRFEIVRIDGDGNCLFRSLSHQLEGHQSNHDLYRELIVQHIQEQRNFEKFLEDGESLDAYCARMSKDGEYGGHMELYSAATIFHCRIMVHVENSDDIIEILPKSGVYQSTINVLYNGVTEHYQSLIIPLNKRKTIALWDYESVGIPNDFPENKGAYDTILESLKHQGLVGPVATSLVVGYNDSYVPSALEQDDRILVTHANDFNRSETVDTAGDQAADLEMHKQIIGVRDGFLEPRNFVFFTDDDKGFDKVRQELRQDGHNVLSIISRLSKCSEVKMHIRSVLGLPIEPSTTRAERRRQYQQIKISRRLAQEKHKEDIELEGPAEEPREEDSDLKPFASLEELEKGRLPPQHILSLPKNYTAENPSLVLYIKNLAEDVTPEDLYYIFGSLFGSIKATKSSLGVRLMQEKGRMRGRAFLTFPSVEVAHRALNLVTGFVFKGKPMIIQFSKNPEAAKPNK